MRALELEGYRVSEVGDGVEALALARQEEFDVLIVDVMMPGWTGWACAASCGRTVIARRC